MRVGDVSFACSQGAHKEDYWLDVPHKGEAGCYVDNLILRYVLFHRYLTADNQIVDQSFSCLWVLLHCVPNLILDNRRGVKKQPVKSGPVGGNNAKHK